MITLNNIIQTLSNKKTNKIKNNLKSFGHYIVYTKKIDRERQKHPRTQEV